MVEIDELLIKQELTEKRLASRVDEANSNTYKLEKEIKQNMADFIKKNELAQNRLQIIVDEIKNELYTEKIDFVSEQINQVNENYEDLKNGFVEEQIKINNKYENLTQTIDELLNQIKISNQQYNDTFYNITNERNSILALTLDLIKTKERKSRLLRFFTIFRRNTELLSSMKNNYVDFIDGLILMNRYFNKNSIITLSNTIPYQGYVEYNLKGYGNNISYFISSNIGAKLFIEVVQNGKIVKQENLTLQHEGLFMTNVSGIKGEVFIRFKTIDNTGIVRLMEICNRKLHFFQRRSLAGYIN